jgi:hypothetical protein
MVALDPVVIPNKNFIPSDETILFDAYELYDFDKTYWKDSWLKIYDRLAIWSKDHMSSTMNKMAMNYTKRFVKRLHDHVLKMLSILVPVFQQKKPLKSVISDFREANADYLFLLKEVNVGLRNIAVLKDELPPDILQILAETIVFTNRENEQIHKILSDMALYEMETNPVPSYANV